MRGVRGSVWKPPTPFSVGTNGRQTSSLAFYVPRARAIAADWRPSGSGFRRERSTQRLVNGASQTGGERYVFAFGMAVGLLAVAGYTILLWQLNNYSFGCNGPAANSVDGKIQVVTPFVLPVIGAILLRYVSRVRRWSRRGLVWSLVVMALVSVCGEALAWFFAAAVCNQN